METDGSPPHCIIYKYGFLYVSITLHCERAHQWMCMCALCVFLYICQHFFYFFFFLLPLYLRAGVPSFCDFVCVCSCMCMLMSTLSPPHCFCVLCISVSLLSLLLCVRIWVCARMPACVCVCGIHTLHVFQVEFFFYSPVSGWKCYSLLIKLPPLSLRAHLVDLSGMFYC